MAFILTPRFVHAQQAPQCSPFGFCAPVSRPAYPYRVTCSQPRRPQYSSFKHFFGQVDELLSEIDRQAQHQAQLEAEVEAQRAAHRQRQQRKRTLRAQFAVSRNEQGWQVDGDIQGFEQHNISVEVTDEHTLKLTGNTEWQAEKPLPQDDAAPAIENPTEEAQDDKADNATPAETETTTVAPDSDTESHKSYQATVEDDFEDLGAETSSLISTSSEASTVSEAKDKGKGKAAEESSPTESTVAQQPQEEASVQSQQEQSPEQERAYGSFERTFRFPERIDTANVRASFNGGALTITVPRAQVQQIRKIPIL